MNSNPPTAVVAPRSITALAVVLAWVAVGNSVTAVYVSYEYYEDSTCATTPSTLAISQNETCENQNTECVATEYGDLVEYESVNCIDDAADALQYTDNMFGDTVYLLVDFFSDNKCEDYLSTTVYRANGDCLFINEGVWATAEVYTDGSASYLNFDTSDCDGEATPFHIPFSSFVSSVCDSGSTYYSNAFASASASTSSIASSASTGSSGASASTSSNASSANTSSSADEPSKATATESSANSSGNDDGSSNAGITVLPPTIASVILLAGFAFAVVM